MTQQEIENRNRVIACLDALLQWDATGVAPCDDTEDYLHHVLDDITPVAEQLGLHKEQRDIQDLVVKLGYPDDYKRIKQLRMESEMTCEMVFRTFALPIKAMLDDMGIEYDFKYRMKSIFSIWRKIRNKNKQFDDVYDLFATRIIYKPKSMVEPLPMVAANELDALGEVSGTKQWQLDNMDVEKFYCWRIYTVISMLYRIHPDRIKNWISNPRPSGYQALQFTVMGPDCNWIEIQIRSERMNYEAEYGQAAHWKYKQQQKKY